MYLWQARTYVRKALEIWFAALMETLWSKRRILEVYLNVIEWGPGVTARRPRPSAISGSAPTA